MPEFGRNRAVLRARMRLSIAQALIGMVAEGWITEAEGRGWAEGNALPDAAEALIAQLPEGQRFPARARLLRASTFERADPLTDALGEAAGLTPEQIDAFFETWADV